MELDFDEVSFSEDRFEKSFLFLEFETICDIFRKWTFWSFWNRHFIEENRQYDELWQALKSVCEEIFQNPLAWWNYIHISFIWANKIFSSSATKNLENRAGRERVKRKDI